MVLIEFLTDLPTSGIHQLLAIGFASLATAAILSTIHQRRELPGFVWLVLPPTIYGSTLWATLTLAAMPPETVPLGPELERLFAGLRDLDGYGAPAIVISVAIALLVALRPQPDTKDEPWPMAASLGLHAVSLLSWISTIPMSDTLRGGLGLNDGATPAADLFVTQASSGAYGMVLVLGLAVTAIVEGRGRLDDEIFGLRYANTIGLHVSQNPAVEDGAQFGSDVARGGPVAVRSGQPSRHRALHATRSDLNRAITP